VIDAAITDGTISLMSFVHGFNAMGMWEPQREQNITDGGSHYYDTYECADGLYISIGAIEQQFYALLVELTGVDLDTENYMAHFDKATWSENKVKVAALFKTKTRQQWTELLEGTDVCFGPVLNLEEARKHHHNVARNSFVEVAGIAQSAPAPRFSATPSAVQGPPVAVGHDTVAVLAGLGLDVNALIEKGAVKAAQ
jgi:alpha-methylacyl-CoA racemase